MPITGQPILAARSMILHIFSPITSPSEPPKTVKSWLKTQTVRPSIVPWPVTTASPQGRFFCMSKSEVRWRTNFAYIDSRYPDGTTLKLCRLRYSGSASLWGFAIYRASHDDYEDSWLPSGTPVGSPEDALDCACGLYLNDPTAWLGDTPTN